MLDTRTLLQGLNVLSRAAGHDYFADGHRGAAMIAGAYLCDEQPVEPGVENALAAIIDRWCQEAPLCAPLPDEAPDASLLGDLRDCLGEHMSGLRQVGHNVIFGALALKALTAMPEAITPTRIAGICRTVASFVVTPVLGGKPVNLPDMADLNAAATFVMQEFVCCTERFQGRGQGWSGHLLTYARALLDLRAMGESDLARQAEDGFATYIRRIRLGPESTDLARAEHMPIVNTPLERAYWAERSGDLRLGHQIKYPYGFYGLLDLVQDAELRRRCLAVAYRVL